MLESEEMNNIEWSRFAAGLINFISIGQSSLVHHDYDIVNFKLTGAQIFDELTRKNRIEDLLPELQVVAKQYKEYLDKAK